MKYILKKYAFFVVDFFPTLVDFVLGGLILLPGWFLSPTHYSITTHWHTATPHKHQTQTKPSKRNAQFINLPKCKFEICFLFAFAFDSIHLNLINTYAYIEIVKDTDKYISPSHVTNTTHSLYPSIDFHSSFQQNPNWQIK